MCIQPKSLNVKFFVSPVLLSLPTFIRFSFLIFISISLSLFPVAFNASPASANTYTVTNTNDSGSGSLRQAILDANSNPGPDTISFNISGAGPHTITLATTLPDLLDDDTTINGYSQTDAIEGPLGPGSARVIMIEIDGTGLNGDGPTITDASGCTIRGLVINGFNYGIVITGNSATNNTIEGNYIGTSTDGNSGDGPQYHGVHITDGANNNLIGGTGLTSGNAGNLISAAGQGAWGSGVVIENDAHHNTIQGNYVGTNLAGDSAIACANDGITVEGNTVCFNTIGGENGGEGNLVSGNTSLGIVVQNEAHDNTVWGNWVGLNATGNAAISNGCGVTLQNGAYNNIVGGDTAGRRNIISGNNNDGVSFGWWSGAPTQNNVVIGNYIGTNPSGTSAIANSWNGISINNCGANTIGGSGTGEGNVVSGNSWSGININDSSNITVCGNLIGLNAAGNVAIPNGSHGIHLTTDATGCVIGGSTSGHRNVISGNTNDGIQLQSPSNSVKGNYIGVDSSGTIAITNGGNGISIYDVTGNTIGGSASGEGNVISGNSSQGIYISNSSLHYIRGNIIGLNAAGDSAIANAGSGITILNSSGGSGYIGGENSGETNILSGNGSNGIEINNSSGQYVWGNQIGVNSTGNSAIGNGFIGINVCNGSQYNVIGGTSSARANVISGNSVVGLVIQNQNTQYNQVLGNLIGTDATATLDLGNTNYGIQLHDNTANNTIGSSGGSNIIKFNTADGIVLTSASNQNTIAYNTISENGQNGISVSQSANGTYSNNTITDNPNHGIDVGSSDGSTISNNTITGNGQHGIRLNNANNGTLSGNTLSSNGSGTASEMRSYSYSEFAYDADGSGPNPASPYSSDAQFGSPCGGSGLFYGRNSFDQWAIVCPSGSTDNATLIADAKVAGGFDLALISIGGTGTSNQHQIFFVKDNWADRATAEAALGGGGTIEALVPDAILYNSGDNTFSWNQNWQDSIEVKDPGATVSLNTGYTEFPRISIFQGYTDAAIYITGGSSNNSLQSNTISNGNGNGIAIESTTSTGNSILSNSMHSNAGLGIDLSANSSTDPNDSQDTDTGANNGQNFPVLTTALTGASSTLIEGTLNSTPNTTFTLEFYTNSSADASGYGEGQTLLITRSVTTDASGDADYSYTLAGALSSGLYLTASATNDTTDDTSEFSQALSITVDNTAPTVTIDALNTNDTTPALSGTIDDYTASIVVTVNSFDYSATNNGNGTWTLADNTITPALSENIYDITLVATDTIGNIGNDSTNNELTIDTTAPTVTVNSLLTNDTTPELMGTINDNSASILITVNSGTYTATNNGNGSWTLPDNTISPALAYNTFDVLATATDSAGNYASDSTSNELTIDTTSPTVSTGAATPISETSATLNGTLINLGSASSVDVSFAYGSNPTCSYEASSETLTATGDFSVTLNTLNPGQRYYFRATASGDGTGSGDVLSFMTNAPEELVPGNTEDESTPESTEVPEPTPKDEMVESYTGEGSLNTDDIGVVQEDFSLISEDDVSTIIIPKGTIANNEDGVPQDEPITCQPTLIPEGAPPTDNTIAVYDYGPDGTTFDQPVTITMSYNPALLPEGVNEKDLIIAFFDEATVEWIPLDNIVVDTENNTISGTVTHFTIFAILWPEPEATSDDEVVGDNQDEIIDDDHDEVVNDVQDEVIDDGQDDVVEDDQDEVIDKDQDELIGEDQTEVVNAVQLNVEDRITRSEESSAEDDSDSKPIGLIIGIAAFVLVFLSVGGCFLVIRRRELA